MRPDAHAWTAETFLEEGGAAAIVKRTIFGLLALAIAAAVSVEARAGERFALVIGNGSYDGVSALANPVRDANAMTEMLTSAGFEVSLGRDLGQTQMYRAVSDFAAKLANKGEDTVALVYFAGHGVQVDGVNYMLPVDARLKRETDIPLEAVRLADVVNLLDTVPSKTRILILDACRNNPFDAAGKTGRGLKRIQTRGGSGHPRGLAVVNAPAGTLIAYSTSPGAVAEDGEGKNSPFTAALIKAAEKRGTPVESVFQKVRLAVHKETGGHQTPWEVTALTRPFQFFPGEGENSDEPIPAKSKTAWRSELRSYTPRKAYEIVIVQNDVTVYEIYLSLFPKGPLALRIRGLLERRVEMLAWFEAVSLNTAAAFEAFLKRYPNSDLAETALRLQKRAPLALAATRNWNGILGVTTTPQVRTVVKEVIKNVKVPVVKQVVKEVRVPVVKVKEVVKTVRVPVVKIKEVVKTVRVPSPPKIKTVVKTVRVPVRVPCRCTGSVRTNRGAVRTNRSRSRNSFRLR